MLFSFLGLAVLTLFTLRFQFFDVLCVSCSFRVSIIVNWFCPCVCAHQPLLVQFDLIFIGRHILQLCLAHQPFRFRVKNRWCSGRCLSTCSRQKCVLGRLRLFSRPWLFGILSAIGRISTSINTAFAWLAHIWHNYSQLFVHKNSNNQMCFSARASHCSVCVA